MNLEKQIVAMCYDLKQADKAQCSFIMNETTCFLHVEHGKNYDVYQVQKTDGRGILSLYQKLKGLCFGWNYEMPRGALA